MRPEKLYLVDIVEAADAIDRFLSGIDREEFDEDELRARHSGCRDRLERHGKVLTMWR